jgi:energy-coupling factor transporter ATP-binding protein EcfA2
MTEAVVEAPTADRFAGRRYSEAFGPDRALLAWQDLLTVDVREGRDICFDPRDEAELSWLRQCLLGPALGLVLQQRGALALHASAVALEGEAVVVMGPKGAGKSTIAAAMCGQGGRLLADDIVVIDRGSTDVPHVRPGFPQLKLWTDSAGAVALSPDAVELLHSTSDKQLWNVRSCFWPEPCPIGQLVVLERDDSPGIDPLSPTATFTAVMEHLYAPRFLGSDGVTSTDFERCAWLARTTPAVRYTQTNGLGQLKDTVARLRREISRRRPRELSNADAGRP